MTHQTRTPSDPDRLRGRLRLRSRHAVRRPRRAGARLPGRGASGRRFAPAPCTLVGTKTISRYLGATAKPYSEQAHDGVTLCLYIATTGRMQIEDGSRSNFAKASLATSPLGTVIESEPSLGENGGLVYKTRKAYHFTDAAFERGPYYYAAFSQAILPAKVLALAELVHAKVAR